jgi:hypothetical protein
MTKYTNRYGDVFTFEENENGNIDWKGDFKYTRCGWNDDDKIIFVDPSGGPFISIDYPLEVAEIDRKVVGFRDHTTYWEILIEDNESLRIQNGPIDTPKDTL